MGATEGDVAVFADRITTASSVFANTSFPYGQRNCQRWRA